MRYPTKNWLKSNKTSKHRVQRQSRNNNDDNHNNHRSIEDNKAEGATSGPLHPELELNLEQIRQTLGNSTDIIIKKIPLSPTRKENVAIVYTDGLTDQQIVLKFIMESMIAHFKTADNTDTDSDIYDPTHITNFVKDYVIRVSDVTDVPNFETLYNALLSGDTIILMEGSNTGLIASTGSWNSRAVSEPATENVVRGPQEGFSESLRTNTALIRRKIKDPNLWLETQQIGRVTHTDVGIMFIKSIASDKIVQEVRDRLKRIDIDGILESGYIEELIQDEGKTPFPTVYNSERPDVVAGELLEGKVAILVDGTPFVLIVPAPFVSFLHAAEDYYQRADISTFIRILRYAGTILALVAPSIYIAITTYHQEMLPTQLLIGLAAQRESIPFPAFIEALMMEVTFEILREAGVRMPRNVGSAVSIVGTLVIGQAAVEAGIISAAMVIVVAITAISSFVIPSYNMSISFRMLRFPLMMLAASFGLFGIIVGIIALILHMCSLRTFGIPYMTPLAPLIPADTEDTIIRLPHRLMRKRPRLYNQKNQTRANNKPPQKSRE